MRSHVTGLIIGALLLAVPASAQSGLESLPPILRLAINSSQRLKYSGERMVEFKRGVERYSHRELILRDGPRMRLEFPSGSKFSGQIIVETGRDRYHFFPDSDEIHILPPRIDETRSRLMMLAGKVSRRGFRVSLGNTDTIAGIVSREVIVLDGDGNLDQKLWIDPKTGLLLRRELFDKVGARRGLAEFIRVRFSPQIVPGDFAINRPGAKRIYPEDLARRSAAEANMRFFMLPRKSGFRLESTRLLRRSEVPVLVQSYASREGTLSFFQVLGPLNQERMKRFARNEFLVESWTQDGYSFALVGNFSRERLRNIARKLQAD